MTERYEVHNMIQGMDIGETMDLEVCKSLIEKYDSSRDIELLITDNGRNMTYGEVAEQLNRYYKREEILKQSDTLDDLSLFALNLQEKLKESKEENEQLKSKYSEQCTQLDFLKDENQHMRDLVNENKQLKSILKEMVRVSEDNGAISPMRVKSMTYNFIGDFE